MTIFHRDSVIDGNNGIGCVVDDELDLLNFIDQIGFAVEGDKDVKDSFFTSNDLTWGFDFYVSDLGFGPSSPAKCAVGEQIKVSQYQGLAVQVNRLEEVWTSTLPVVAVCFEVSLEAS